MPLGSHPKIGSYSNTLRRSILGVICPLPFCSGDCIAFDASAPPLPPPPLPEVESGDSSDSEAPLPITEDMLVPPVIGFDAPRKSSRMPIVLNLVVMPSRERLLTVFDPSSDVAARSLVPLTTYKFSFCNLYSGFQCKTISAWRAS
jgi:hypothetical protein